MKQLFEYLKKDETGFFLFEVLLAVCIFFPMYTSWNDHKFFADFIVSNLALLGVMIWVLLTHKKTKDRKTPIIYGSLLVIYNILAFSYNYTYLHWYSTQVNMTIIYSFFIVLMTYRPQIVHQERRENIVHAAIRMIMISSVAAMIYKLMQYERLIFRNWNLYACYPNEGYYENRFSWMFDHKSEYGFMLMAFLALFIRYRRLFKSKLRAIVSVGLLLGCLALTHCWTDMIGAAIIILGAVLDELIKRHLLFTKRNMIAVGGVAALGVIMLRVIAGERNLLTLGSRTMIWKASVDTILANPQGCGKAMLEVGVPAAMKWVNNCHNYFLNEMFRYSLPVGIVSSIMLLGIFVLAVIKNRNFFTVGTVFALFIALNMDYCLLIQHMALFLFIFYLTFLHGNKNQRLRRRKQHDN